MSRAYNADNIPLEVSRFRADGEIPIVLPPSPLYGGGHTVYKLGFSDGIVWSIRIPAHKPEKDDAALKRYTGDRIRVLHHLEICDFDWAPRVIGFDLTFQNQIGIPYGIMTWFEGTPLQWSDNTPARREDRNKIIVQLAVIFDQMIRRTVFRGVECENAIDWINDRCDNRTLRFIKGDLHGFAMDSCFILRNLALECLNLELLEAPSFFSHTYLVPDNIIVDGDFNIQGLIDWDLAKYTPYEIGALPPDLLMKDPMLPESPVYRTDRLTFADTLLQIAEIMDDQWLKMVAESFKEPNISQKSLIITAVSCKSEFRMLVERSYFMSKEELEQMRNRFDLEGEMDSFLQRPTAQEWFEKDWL